MSNLKIRDLLASKTISRLETEIILAEILKVDRSFLKAFSEKSLSSNTVKKFNNLLSRRGKGEPLPYLLGYKEFYGRKFLINENVLIPRPETENLVTDVLKFANNRNLSVVDVGTGSGVIGITLTLENPKLKVTLSDADGKALEVTRKNAKLFGVEGSVKIIQSDLLEKVAQGIDVIVANLPYIPTEKWQKLPKEIKKFEPRVALDSGKTKTILYEKLFIQAKQKLNKSGKIFFEVDGDIFIKSF